MTDVKHTNIYEALHTAQATMPNATLNKTNPHFKSKYADLTSIREATLPSLNANGITLTQPTTIILDVGLKVSTELHLATNPIEAIVAEWLVPFGTPQAMGSGLTYGRRYTWATVCGITAEEDDDANAAETSARVKQGAADIALGQDVLSKAKSRPVYEALVVEMRALTDREALKKWGLENTGRIYSMHDDFQRFFRDDYGNHMTAIKEGVTEDGRDLKTLLRQSVGKLIDDEIPEPGSQG